MFADPLIVNYIIQHIEVCPSLLLAFCHFQCSMEKRMLANESVSHTSLSARQIY